jgi:hypothetical protein
MIRWWFKSLTMFTTYSNILRYSLYLATLNKIEF